MCQDVGAAIAVSLLVVLLSYFGQNCLAAETLPSTVMAGNDVVRSLGWLLTMICYFLLNFDKIFQSVILVAVYTTNWFCLTRFFVLIKRATEKCLAAYDLPSESLDHIGEESSCMLDGGYWVEGFDISGHTFLLSFAILLLYPVILPTSLCKLLRRLFAGFYCLFCVFMLTVTALYFHTMNEKVLALFFSISSFFLLKRCVVMARELLGQWVKTA